MSLGIEFKVSGKLTKDVVTIVNEEMISTLSDRGYGEINNKFFFLKPFESLYLLYYNQLIIHKKNKNIDFNSLMETCIKYDENILTKFLIYRDLRTKGYVVKDGFGFGSDFRVYEHGAFGIKGAKYLIFGFDEGKQEKIYSLQKKINQIIIMGKEPIIAVIERRGEIIYYKISKINFLDNIVEDNFNL